jgi:hypothetical protein
LRWLLPLLILSSCLLCSAQAASPLPFWERALTEAPVTITQIERPPASSACSDTFVAHRLPFSTGTRLREIGTYTSNGAGVAAGDLDGDGDLDLVFASVDRESSILWNKGNLTFEPHPLPARFTRGVVLADIDGDGRLDLSFTHRGLVPPSFWRNQPGPDGRPQFAPMTLPGVDHFAYALAWGDVDGDGALDLVTGSYAAEMKQHGINAPEDDPSVGLILYRRSDEAWTPTLLDRVAETLSIGILDLTGDGRPEIWVANDFAVPDQVWQQNGPIWRQIDLFAQTSHSTMSLEWGDLGGDGQLALFSTDMAPYDISPRTMAAWLPVMDHFGEHRAPGDPQRVANMLQIQDTHGRWRNRASIYSVEATGWSWAGRFGDLDQDGLLDLYVVNGMIAADMFAHLPGSELVEANQIFRNGGRIFQPAPQWGLGSTASGRGMIMADLDDDGDLDLVMNNLRSAAQLFENQLCQGASLQVEARWPEAHNHFGIGAQVLLQTEDGVQMRDLRASGGYLSGDAPRVHFGFPADAAVQALHILWPDGARSTVDAPPSSGRIVVTRRNY